MGSQEQGELALGNPISIRAEVLAPVALKGLEQLAALIRYRVGARLHSCKYAGLRL